MGDDCEHMTRHAILAKSAQDEQLSVATGARPTGPLPLAEAAWARTHGSAAYSHRHLRRLDGLGGLGSLHWAVGIG